MRVRLEMDPAWPHKPETKIRSLHPLLEEMKTDRDIWIAEREREERGPIGRLMCGSVLLIART